MNIKFYYFFNFYTGLLDFYFYCNFGLILAFFYFSYALFTDLDLPFVLLSIFLTDSFLIFLSVSFFYFVIYFGRFFSIGASISMVSLFLFFSLIFLYLICFQFFIRISLASFCCQSLSTTLSLACLGSRLIIGSIILGLDFDLALMATAGSLGLLQKRGVCGLFLETEMSVLALLVTFPTLQFLDYII